MTFRKIYKCLLFFTILAILTVVKTDTCESQMRMNAPVQKVKELERLIHQKRAEGKDVSRAVELKKRSRKVFMDGNQRECLRLLAEATALLKGNLKKAPIQKEEIFKKIDRRNVDKEIVELPVSTPNVSVTYVVPDYDSGKAMGNCSNCFDARKIESENGKVTLELSSIPIIVEEVAETSFEKKLVRENYDDSPFGIHGIESHYDENTAYLADLGVKWVRYAGISGIIWDFIESEKGKFNWRRSDELYLKNHKKGINMVVTILSPNKWDQSVKKRRPKHMLPVNIESYKQFLRKVVKRYDGDGGIDDAFGSPVVNYWQIGNEVDDKISWSDTMENYGELLKISYEVIKEANPSAKVVVAGFAGINGYYKFYRPLFNYLHKEYPDKKFFDVIDCHWFRGGSKDQPLGSKMEGFINDLKKQLKKTGYADIPVWITEMANYDGRPIDNPVSGKFVRHSEEEQASSLFKMYIYALTHGFEKAFWVTIREWHGWGGRINNYFDNVGLINNPENDGLTHKKLAYFTYKLMVDKLNEVDFNKVEILNIGKNIHAYKFQRRNQFIYVLWYDK